MNDFEELIERSSLGSPAAKSITARTPPAVAHAIVLASDYLRRAEEAEAERDQLRGLLRKLKAERIVARSCEDSGRLYDAEMYGSVAVTADEIALFDAIETEDPFEDLPYTD